MDKSIQKPASLRTLVFLFQKQHTQQSQNSGPTLLQKNLLIILKNLHTKKEAGTQSVSNFHFND